MRLGKRAPASAATPSRFPGVLTVVDGRSAVLAVEAAAREVGRSALGAAVFPPAGDDTAGAVTAGLSLAGLRAAAFTGGASLAQMHATLAAAGGRRLPIVFHVVCRALPRHAHSVHASHDDYHAVADAGGFQLFARDVQQAADLALIAHRVAELALTPGLCAQDGVLTSDALESVRLPERDLVRCYLGDPADLIDCPTPAQRLIFGERRRRIPEAFDLDYPAMSGVVQNQDAFHAGVAAQRVYFSAHVRELADRAFDEYAALTGRAYARLGLHRVDDAQYVIVAQGSVVALAEAVADHLRTSRRLRVGVMSLTMFRPFPADALTAALHGKRAVLVLERTDQPLAADPPLLREIRAAMSQALENWRAGSGEVPHPGVAECGLDDLPTFHAAAFGLGGRELHAGDLIAAMEAVARGAGGRRHVYLGVDFVRPGTRLPKLQIWQERLLENYPDLPNLALTPTADALPRPPGGLAVRIDGLSGGGLEAMGRALVSVAAELLGVSVKAVPRRGAERKGLPTTFRFVLNGGSIPPGGDDGHADVALVLDPAVLRGEEPLAGLGSGGLVVVDGGGPDADVWERLSLGSRQVIHKRALRLFAVDGARIAAEESTDADRRAWLQGAAFLGAFFKVAPLPGAAPDPARLVQVLRRHLATRPGRLDAPVVEPILRAVSRGHAEVRSVDVAGTAPHGDGLGTMPERPVTLDPSRAQSGPGHPGRFWEQVGYLHVTGQEGIADPFAALGVLPAGSSAIRDLSAQRVEVPEFLPARCTGCGQCWTQCPDVAILGLATPVEDVIGTVVRMVGEHRPAARLQSLVKPIGGEVRRLLREEPHAIFSEVLGRAYTAIVDRLDYTPDRRAAVDAEFGAVAGALEGFPLTQTAVLFQEPETRTRGSGALLSVTVNPEACKGCGLCVEACPEGALRAVPQTAIVLERLRAHWRLWERLPDTDEAYVNAASADEHVGPLPALLLRKANARSMVGGDVACPGCGEKTVLHLVLSAVHAQMEPRVRAHIAHLDDLVTRLDQKGRAILASDADLQRLAGTGEGTVGVPLDNAKKAHVDRISRILAELKDLRWRYTEGPGGRGRAALGMANATGCSSVWASTFPLNPYPFPWIHLLDHDAPAVALGLFEGQMRKMAAGFAAVRRAELELADEYDPATHDAALAALDWRAFTDDELRLCPPILAVGGDGAMLDGGLGTLSAALTSGRPIRVIVLDTQGASSAGGQATSASFLGPDGDGTGTGGAELAHARKELALLAIAHRGVFVLQSCQAAPAHLAAGVLRGLDCRFPALFHLLSPCPTEHRTGDHQARHAARLALESRAFPLLMYDPAAAPSLAGRLSLAGNPATDQPWPVYRLQYIDAGGVEQSMELPVTVADWAASEGRFRAHFTPAAADAAEESLVRFDEYLRLSADEREGKSPFIYTLGEGRQLGRLIVGTPIVWLAEDRQEVWATLRDLGGLKQPDVLALQAEFEGKLSAVHAEYSARLADLRARYPKLVARRLAEVLLRAGDAPGLGALVAGARASAAAPVAEAAVGEPVAVAPPAEARAPAVTAAPAAPAAASAAPLSMEPYIDTPLCTACNECTNLNKRMFAYNASKQAYIKDPKAGTFQQLVRAAEKCPVRIIHPGTPLDPAEKDLDKWIARAKPFS